MLIGVKNDHTGSTLIVVGLRLERGCTYWTVAALGAGSAKKLPPNPVFVRSSVKTANWNAGWVTSPSVLHFHWPVCQAVAGTLCSVLVCLPKHTAVEEEKEGRDGLSNVYLLSWSWTVQRCKAWPREGVVAFCPRGVIPRDFGVCFVFFFFFFS